METVHEQVHHRPFGVGIITSQAESILKATFAFLMPPSYGGWADLHYPGHK